MEIDAPADQAPNMQEELDLQLNLSPPLQSASSINGRIQSFGTEAHDEIIPEANAKTQEPLAQNLSNVGVEDLPVIQEGLLNPFVNGPEVPAQQEILPHQEANLDDQQLAFSQEVVLALPAEIQEEPENVVRTAQQLVPQEVTLAPTVHLQQGTNGPPLQVKIQPLDVLVQQIPENAATATFNLNLNVNMALTNWGFTEESTPQMDPGRQDFCWGLLPPETPYPKDIGAMAITTNPCP